MPKFLKFLEKVRSYPDETKKLIGYIVSGIMTFIFVSLSFVVPAFFKKEPPLSVPERQMSSPFFVIKKEFSGLFSKMKDSAPFPSKTELSVFLKNLSSSEITATSSLSNTLTATTTTSTTTPKEKIRQ